MSQVFYCKYTFLSGGVFFSFLFWFGEGVFCLFIFVLVWVFVGFFFNFSGLYNNLQQRQIKILHLFSLLTPLG